MKAVFGKNREKGNSIENLLLVLIFMYSLGVNHLSGIILSGAFIICLLSYPRRYVDTVTIALGIFGVFYVLSLYIYESVTYSDVIRNGLLPLAAYYVGFKLGLGKKAYQGAYVVAAVLAAGFYVQAMLNLSVYISKHGFAYYTYRRAYDIWRGGAIVSVTGANLYLTPMCFFAIGILLTDTSRKRKICAMVSVITILIATFLYRNRTLIFSVAIVVSVVCVYRIRRRKVFSVKQVCLAVGIIMLCLLFIGDAGGIRSEIMKTPLVDRILNDEGGRVNLWIEFLSGDWWRYPLGGRKIMITGTSYVHNLWLDTWRRAGIVPFVTLVYVTCEIAKPFLFRIKVREEVSYQRDVLYIMLFGMLLNFAVEPLIEANPYVFCGLLLIGGAVRSGIMEEPGAKRFN